MSKMDEQDFKFPDEIDEKDQVQEEKLEIEIEDDTPEEDRGRTPLPKEITEKLDKDELSQYDEDVKQKLLQMKKAWHDERRAKEAALREHEEAVAYARRLMEDNKKVRSVLQSGEKQFAENMQQSAEVQLALAQREYKDAYESGDVDRITEATTKLNSASMRVENAKNFKMPSLQEEESPVTINTKPEQPQVQRPDMKALAWQQRNQWFGADDEMTASALGLHQKLVRTGEVEVGSDEYYDVLDKTMRKRFPEFFGEETSNNSKEVAEVQRQAKRAPTVVAPAVRSTASNKVKLSQRQVMLAKKLGLTPEQYAIEMKRLEK